MSFLFSFLNPHLRIFIINFRERGREREGEKDLLVAFFVHPNWGLKLQPFSVWDNAPIT